MTTEEIQTKLQHAKELLDIRYRTAAAIRKLLEKAEAKLEEVGEEYDESEILDLVTDDA